jgi:prolyl 4-hydroxylase
MSIAQWFDAANNGDAQAQFSLAQTYAQQANFSRAKRWFARAAEQEHAAALTELALFALHGVDPTTPAQDAVELFKRAMQLGSAEAAYNLALLRVGGVGLAQDVHAFAQELVFAAQGGFIPARQCLALLGERPGIDDGLRRIAATVAEWKNGAAPSEADLLRLASCAFDEVDAQLTMHSDVARVVTVDAVFSAAECRFLCELAAPTMERAKIFDPRIGAATVADWRSNRSASLGPAVANLSLRLLEYRLASVAQMPLTQAEYAAVLHYAVGEEYRPHCDYLEPAIEPMSFLPGAPGQRRRTIFAYLNDVESGGETQFTQLDLKIQPRLGRIVMFDNVDAAGQIEPRSQHASLPVLAGEKWLCTVWLRERALRTL